MALAPVSCIVKANQEYEKKKRKICNMSWQWMCGMRGRNIKGNGLYTENGGSVVYKQL